MGPVPAPVDRILSHDAMRNLKVDDEHHTTTSTVEYVEAKDGNISDSSAEGSLCSGGEVVNVHEVTPESGIFYSTNGYAAAAGYAYEYASVDYEEYPRYVTVDPTVYDTSGSLAGYGYAYAPYAVGVDGQIYAQPYPFAAAPLYHSQYQMVDADFGGDVDKDAGQRPGYPVAYVSPQCVYPRGVMAVHTAPNGGNYEGLRANAPPWVDMRCSNQRRPTGQSNKSQAHSQASQSHKSTSTAPAALPGALGTNFPPLTRAVLNGTSTAKTGRGTTNGTTTDGTDSTTSKAKGKEAGPDSTTIDEASKGTPRGKVRFQRLTPGMFKQPSKGGYDVAPAAIENVTSRDRYNKSDFPIGFEDARFFVIKSYSEDDVHKSIKYGVWASTPNGNKKLDAAYREATSSKKPCPVFLYFSVNASGQFCGVAEMTGPVDFVKCMDFWQQEKWSGCFSVKWHFIKDMSNQLFRHITLENNDNKPVTFSRDTQEVQFAQGLEMLKIFRNYTFHKSILDDFQYYEERQKALQEKRSRSNIIKQQQESQKPQIQVRSSPSFVGLGLPNEGSQGSTPKHETANVPNKKVAPENEVSKVDTHKVRADEVKNEVSKNDGGVVEGTRKSYLKSLADGGNPTSNVGPNVHPQVEVDVKAA